MTSRGGRARRLVVGTVGWVTLLVGVALFPLPGPGLLVMAVGLAILAREFEWAERRVDDVRRRALLEAVRGVRTPARAPGTVSLTLLLTASGLLWLWAPTQPGWWVLPSWTWLPGGLWSGVGQILSGLVTLALVGYAWTIRHAPAAEFAESSPREGGETTVDSRTLTP